MHDNTIVNLVCQIKSNCFDKIPILFLAIQAHGTQKVSLLLIQQCLLWLNIFADNMFGGSGSEDQRNGDKFWKIWKKKQTLFDKQANQKGHRLLEVFQQNKWLHNWQQGD